MTDSSLVAFTAFEIPFAVTNESKRQNTMEFLAVILGLLIAWRCNVRNFHYQLHGDSISSLAWAKADRVNSTLARRENIMFTTISIHLNATVADTVHVPGKLNVIFDGLSRGLSLLELGLDPTLFYNTATDVGILQLIMLCDPSLELTDISAANDKSENTLSVWLAILPLTNVFMHSVKCGRTDTISPPTYITALTARQITLGKHTAPTQ